MTYIPTSAKEASLTATWKSSSSATKIQATEAARRSAAFLKSQDHGQEGGS
jgi:hypothetical protein